MLLMIPPSKQDYSSAQSQRRAPQRVADVVRFSLPGVSLAGPRAPEADPRNFGPEPSAVPDTGPRIAAHQNATSSSLVTSAAAAAAVAFSAEEDRNLMSEALTSRLTRAAPSRSVH
jgi:hypothetical protein